MSISYDDNDYTTGTSKKKVEKVEMAACVDRRARDCVRRSLAKAMLPLEELNFRVTV